ncbi:hypothetical protein LOK49_LG10G01057 [Camellia lanceoleosa]|uniref:Uncharacterized protein n=1 Tax=Camellia lanceoleosa TaxID=1840588 RepID=A0ACC0GBB5_9ERIC|nr:hypothetical protein LOK49_LG10G01057 [Camellia lanceoleosa]
MQQQVKENGKNVVVEKPLDEDIESFLSSCVDDPDIENKSFTKLQCRSTGITSEGKNGFSFEEFGSIHASKGKVLCCHFSLDGKLLASAGRDKKHVNSFDSTHTTKAHVQLIADVCFRPNSYIFATSSFDSTGATRQVQFQPHIGNLLAAVSRNKISLIDVETNRLQCYLKGHDKEVCSICWDMSGKYMAFVSEDNAKIWSVVSGGKCVHLFHSNGNKFESGAFHLRYSQLVVIGSYKIEIFASMSHDQIVKLWR